MKALLTSCGRPDLLEQTLFSLGYAQRFKDLRIIVHEDHPTINLEQGYYGCEFIQTNSIGQHGSIEKFLTEQPSEKYYLHLEDDWKFFNNYDWIKASIDLMEKDPTIIKVLARYESPHPCNHDHKFLSNQGKTESEKFGYIHPWTGNDNITWHGFSWNPGVTRMDLLKQFLPLPKWEQDLAKNIHDAGYRVVELKRSVYKHIGDGRSTHD